MAKCINKNTIFYKELVKENYNEYKIAKINLAIESDSFKKWYANGEYDTFGMPRIIKGLYLINDKNQQIKITDLLNDEKFENHQKYVSTLSALDKINKFLYDEKVALTKRVSVFKGTEYGKELQDVLGVINRLNENDYKSALVTHTEYILKTINNFEKAINTREKWNEKDYTKEQNEKYNKDYKNFLKEAMNFLQSFQKIKNLETPLNDEDLKSIIKTLKDVESRVTELQNRVNEDVRKIVKSILMEHISNPEIVQGKLDLMDASTDESKFQVWLDALGDSHIPFLAAIDKMYKVSMEDKKEEAKEYKKEWRNFIKKFNGNFNTTLDRLLEKIDGQKTGSFIQEYKQDFYDQMDEHLNNLGEIAKLKGKNSIEYRRASNEFNKWKIENQEQKYIDSYYEVLNKLMPEARELIEEINENKRLITDKNPENITLEEWDEVRKLDNKLKWLKSSVNPDGSAKTGLDLEIANNYFKYSQELSKFYETKSIAIKAYKRARAEAEEKGREFLEQWDFHNTKEEYTKTFWNKFQNIIDKYPKWKSFEDINNQIKQLTIAYKNEKGEIKVEELPIDVRKKLDELQDRKNQIKSAMNKSLSALDKNTIQNEFQQLIEFLPTSYYLKIAEQKKTQVENGTITLDEYNRWYSENHVENEYTGEISPISIYTKMTPRDSKYKQTTPNNQWTISDIKDEFLNPNFKKDVSGYGVPKKQWLSNEYINLSNEDKENLKYIQDLLRKLVSHNKNKEKIVRNIPAIPSSKAEFDKAIKDEKEKVVQQIIDETDEIVKFIPFKYIQKYSQEKLKPITDDMTDEQKEEIKKENKAIARRNKTQHGAFINYNLEQTMEHFIDSALNNKYKTEMLVDLALIQEEIKRLKIKTTDAQGRSNYDFFKSKIKGENVAHEVDSKNSNMVNHFNQWLEGVFYEEFELDEGWLTDWSKKLQNFNSFRNIGFNVLSGLNNSIVGNLMERIESAGSRYYNYTEYRKGQKLYINNILNMINDRDKKESNNFLTAFIKDMDILISEDELNEKPEGVIATSIHKMKMIRDAAYFLQHIGEHQIQNGTLLAMAQSHRIIDGKIIAFNEWYESKKFKVDGDMKIEEALENIKNNEELKKNLTTEFESYTSVLDAFELKDGYSVLKDNIQLNKNELANFKLRVIGINQRLHGIYTTEDYGTMQRYALGRLGMQFRKWMRPGWNRRFGAQFGKKQYNERIRDYEQGMYITTAKYLASPFTNNWKQHRKNQENIAYSAYKTLIDGVRDLFFNSKIRWHTLSENEKADVKRTALEMTFLTTVIALGFLAKNLKGDADDDKLKKKMLTLVLYQADRLFGELTVFTPMGIPAAMKMFSSPAPVFNLLDDATKLFGAMFMYPFRDDDKREFQTGIYRGHDKVSIYFQRMLPIWNHILTIMNMNSSNQRYGMFR